MKRHPLVVSALAIAACAWLSVAAPRGAVVKFYSDDPIGREPETQDASKVEEWDIDLFWDLSLNLFGDPGDPTPDVKAQNVNTIDEVPDSSWFTNRILSRPVPVDEATRGPVTGGGPAPGTWTVVRPKESGFAPGFTMQDGKGETWFVSFDARGFPEAATGAVMVANKIFWTLGYWQVENHLIEIAPDRIVLGEKARITPPSGKRRPMRQSDLDDVFRRSHRSADGTYRAVAGRAIPGRVLGGFRFHGTRPDDPNDIVPHEHRRELRGARVFGAWLNHDDSRGVNSLDMLVSEGTKRYVKHYMFDFGSILGSGTVFAQRHRAGNEYIFEWKPGLLTLATLGLYTRPWMHIDYPPDTPPAIGRFEAESFDPTLWKPEYPNPAFDNMRADDAFWAARIVASIEPATIRAVVEKARYGDPRATDYLTDALVTRREKVLRQWLTAVNPVVDVALSDAGGLTFANAAERAGVATPAERYVVQWARFDNATGEAAAVGGPAESATMTATAPPALVDGARDGDIVQVTIAARHAEHASWATPVTAHFRRAGGAWTPVGLKRLP
jgi:hypothetical protein